MKCFHFLTGEQQQTKNSHRMTMQCPRKIKQLCKIDYHYHGITYVLCHMREIYLKC